MWSWQWGIRGTIRCGGMEPRYERGRWNLQTMSRHHGFLCGYHIYWLFWAQIGLCWFFLSWISLYFSPCHIIHFHDWKCLWRKRKGQMLKASHGLHLRIFASSRGSSGDVCLWPHFPDAWMLAGKETCLCLLSSYRRLKPRDQALPIFPPNLSIMLHSYHELGKEWCLLSSVPKISWLRSVTPSPALF